MKLDYYCVSEAFQQSDFATAITFVAHHFGLPSDVKRNLYVMRSRRFQPEIEISYKERIYSWHRSHGFRTWSSAWSRSSDTMAVAIYTDSEL